MELRYGITLNGSLSAMDMKGEELRTLLPEDLVERILAMVPFPQIFKARALSKSWHAKLSSISSHDDQEKKLLAQSFQKRACEWSDKWETFCPVFLLDDFLHAYDLASQNWRRLPFLSALPERGAITAKAHRRRYIGTSIVGALVLLTYSNPGTMFVGNILTGSWKDLPPLPHMHRRQSTPGRLVSSKDTYKVIRLHTHVGCACAWIYDSKLGAWRSKRLEIPEILEDFELGLFDVYLSGVLYVAVHVEKLFWSFLAFDVEQETFSLIQMPPTGSTSVEWLHSPPLLTCNGTVYIVQPKSSRSVLLVEVDFVTRSWSQVIRETPLSFKFGCLSYEAASDGDYLFFHELTGRGKIKLTGKVVAYNVRNDEWSYVASNPILQQCFRSRMPFTFTSTSFQPGMNPFLEV